VETLSLELELVGERSRARLGGLAPVEGSLREGAALAAAHEALLRTPLEPALNHLVGAALWEVLAGAGVTALIQQALARGGRLELAITASGRWQERAWELLRPPEAQAPFLCLEPSVRLFRRMAPGVPRDRPEADEPAALVVGGDPELAALWPRAVVLESPSREALAEALSQRVWSVVHLAGHGEAGVWWLGEEAISADDLGAMCRGRIAGACILALCEGAGIQGTPRRYDQDWSGLAGRLASAGVPEVVASRAPVLGRDISAFSRAWHSAWLERADALEATARARSALASRGSRAALAGVQVLHVRATG